MDRRACPAKRCGIRPHTICGRVESPLLQCDQQGGDEKHIFYKVCKNDKVDYYADPILPSPKGDKK